MFLTLRWCMNRAGEAGGVHDWQISRGKQIRGQKNPDRGGRPWDGELLGGWTDGEIVRQMSGMGGGGSEAYACAWVTTGRRRGWSEHASNISLERPAASEAFVHTWCGVMW